MSLCVAVSEPAVGVSTEEIQEQQRLAEALGGLYQLLPLLLQDSPGQLTRGVSRRRLGEPFSDRRLFAGRFSAGQPPAAGLHGQHPRGV